MLEEARMDKKSLNRSSLQQSRTTSIDCKKSTELTHKPWLRNNKKREGNNVQKNEPNRRNVVPQRGRGQIDRRPQNRGASSSLMGGTQNTGIEEDDEPEIGSVFVPGSKKQNLNHLLNFMYPSRGGQDRRANVPIPRRQNHRVSYKHEHDLYLRAYCQFVVKEDGDYKVNLLDPDLPIKWDQVEEIVVRSTGRSECPICLGAPVAGRVGHCGHVYCWACMLHYTATHDKQPPPCPVCSTPIQVPEMKPTKMVQWESPADEVTMRLVRRLRGSTVVEIAPPRGQITDIDDTTILPLSSLNDAPYTKLFSASKQQVFDILERERKELEAQILAEIDTTEVVYLEQALEMLKLKEEKLKVQYEQPIVEKEIEEISPIVIQKQDMSNNRKLDWFDVSEEGAACIEIVQDEMAELSIQSNLNPEAESFVQNDINDNQLEEFPLTESALQEAPSMLDNAITDIDKENQAKYFYFYQADDGQQVFLNSLNVRVLNASWGALAAAPAVIRGRVLHRETLSLSDQTRKHMPYTAHLPLHCSFDIVELELQPPYVTLAALNSFGAELDRRARLRARHERDERRRERAYRRAQEGPPRPDFFSNIQFPPAQNTFGSPPLAETALANFEEVNPPSEVATPPPLEQACSSASSPPATGLSFAKMASTSGTWRVRKTALPPPPPPEDDEAAGPRALVLSDAIEAALRTVPSPSGKKNKKNKPKLLFATGMQHSA
ncbi:E3 ubiquitin-protein ligase RNF10 [Epargyreus clarus]|uniref:E3 ubiquitin-protein ligase RNF10 n=1 Tax=Epargyreus clarus TaxID=520877 RepID=UPI003C30647A